MNLYWVFRHYLPDFNGASLIFENYLPNLSKLGVEPKILTTVPRAKYEPDRFPKYPHIFRSKPSVQDATHLEGWLIQNLDLSTFQSCDEGAILQTLSSHPKTLFALLRKKVKHPQLRAVHIGSMIEGGQLPPTMLHKKLKAMVRLQLESRVFSRSIALSSAMVEGLNPYMLKAGKISVINNGVDMDLFRPANSADEQASLRKELNLPENAFIALFTGSIIHRKGVDRLLESWKAFSKKRPNAELCLVIVGDANRPNSNDGETEKSRRAFVEMVKAEVEEMSSIRLVPLQTKFAVAKYMRAANVFVFPTRKEGLPSAVLEAISSGLPVILTEFLGMQTEELGVSGEHLIVSRPEDIANHLDALWQNEGKRAQMSQKGRAWALQRFSVDASVSDYVQMYREVLASKRWH